MSEALFDDYEPVPEPRPEPRKWTERQMLDLLAARYGKVIGGNGPRYAYAEHVRSAAGFDARRCMDFLAMSLWPSDNLAIHGHEVKVSRSDWLTELKDPDKAEAFRPYCDHWWLVVSDRSIVRDDLPFGWGLMAVSGDRLRVIKPAPRLHAQPLPKTMIASVLRATGKTATRAAQPAERVQGEAGEGAS